LILCLVLCYNKTMYAQANTAGKTHVEQFFKTTTLVVKDDKPFSFFNVYLKEAMDTYWTITPFKYIEDDEFEKYCQNEDYSFLIFTEASYIENKKAVKVDVLNFVLGHKGDNINNMPDLGTIPLCYVDDDDEKYLYKMPAFVKLIQYQVNMVRENSLYSVMSVLNYHNKFTSEIKNKDLWLIDEELLPEVNTIEKIKKSGLTQVKIKTRDDLEEAIETGKDILFVHIVAPYEPMQTGKVWKFVIGAKDGKVYFIGEEKYNSKNSGISESDLRGFAR